MNSTGFPKTIPNDVSRNHDKGSYVGQCVQCGNYFIGPKRILLCKKCLEKSNKK